MHVSAYKIRKFRSEIWKYYRKNKRDFPWRRTTNPYRILVSEIMLQQTQTERVMPKYRAFLKRFSNFQALAQASLADVLAVWQGLGYNRRALALKNISKIVVTKYNRRLPRDPKLLVAFPGIGGATAGAVVAFAFNKPVSFIETNIRRVFIHFFFSRSKAVHDEQLLEVVLRTMDRVRPREWYWALMDYGAMLSKLSKNPNRKSANYRKQSAFRGSMRQLRGKILKSLLEEAAPLEAVRIADRIRESKGRVEKALAHLEKEGFLEHVRGRFSVR